MKLSKMTTISVCLAMGLTAYVGPSQAFSWRDLLLGGKKNTPSSPVVTTAPAPQAPSQHLPDARYPNGLGWRAVESDFIDVKQRISVVEGKVDDVKADTEEILLELEDIDADHVTIMNDLSDIKADLANVAGDVTDIADDVETLKNTLQVQVSVEPADADARNEVNDEPVTIFVQVTQNGVGLAGLPADAFLFSNSCPAGGAGYCGTAACFTEGMNGLYALVLAGDWVAGAYAGTVSVQDSATSATGASIVTFAIPAEPVPVP